MAGVRDNTVSNVVSGGIASFKSVGSIPLKSLKVNFNPIQEGDGDPSPSNIRSITGWTELDIGISKSKNILDPFNNPIWNHSNYSISQTGEVTQSGSDGRGWNNTQISPLNLKKGTYTISYTGGGNCNLRTSIDDYETNYNTTNGVLTFTLSEDAGIKFKFSGKTFPATFNVQIQHGSTAHDYESYMPFTTIPVSWSELGTVYGGYVDPIKGKVVAEWEIIDKPWSEWTDYSTTSASLYVKTAIFTNPVYVASQTGYQYMCNVAKQHWAWTEDNTPHYYFAHTTNPGDWRVYMFLPTDFDTSQNVQVLGKLITPIQYDITPAIIKSLIGQNNIWSNADTVEVEYYFLESLDVYKQRFKTNEPYLQTANGNIANFTTDMISPLKECKVYFKPIQASGTPSPDNVLPISGWNELSIYKRNKNLLRLDLQEGLAYPTTSANTTPRTFDMETYIVGMSSTNYYRRNYTNWVLNVSVSDNEVNFSSGGATGYGIAFPIFLIPGKSYTLSATCTNNGGMGFIFYDKDGNYISNFIGSTAYPKNTTVPENTWVTLIIFYATATNTDFSFTDICLSEGSDGINYEQSVGSYTSITLPSTYYGGCVDLITGQIWAEYEIYEINNAQLYGTYDGTSENGWFFYTVPGITLSSENDGVLCERLKTVSGLGYNSTMNGITFYASGIIRWKEFYGNSISEYNEYLANNPLRITYKLSTPTLVGTLTSTQLKTLKGINNIWSNTNSTTQVKYWTHGSLANRKKVIWNQTVKPVNSDNWVVYNSSNISASFDNGVATVTWLEKVRGYAATLYPKNNVTQTQGDIIYASYILKPSINGFVWGIEFGNNQINGPTISNDGWTRIQFITTANRTYANKIYIPNCRSEVASIVVGMTCQMKNPIQINLTKMFGAGNEPTTTEEFEALCIRNGINLNEYQPYNEGTEVYWYI